MEKVWNYKAMIASLSEYPFKTNSIILLQTPQH